MGHDLQRCVKWRNGWLAVLGSAYNTAEKQPVRANYVRFSKRGKAVVAHGGALSPGSVAKSGNRGGLVR